MKRGLKVVRYEIVVPVYVIAHVSMKRGLKGGYNEIATNDGEPGPVVSMKRGLKAFDVIKLPDKS